MLLVAVLLFQMRMSPCPENRIEKTNYRTLGQLWEGCFTIICQGGAAGSGIPTPVLAILASLSVSSKWLDRAIHMNRLKIPMDCYS